MKEGEARIGGGSCGREDKEQVEEEDDVTS